MNCSRTSALLEGDRVNNKPINLIEKLGLFSEQWAPKVVAEMNDY
jgi:hypothetical protein